MLVQSSLAQLTPTLGQKLATVEGEFVDWWVRSLSKSVGQRERHDYSIYITIDPMIVRLPVLSFPRTQAPNHVDHGLLHRKSSRLYRPLGRATCRGNGEWSIVLTSVHRFNPGEL